MRKNTKRRFSLFLAVILVVAVLPFSGSAQQLEETKEIAAEVTASTEVIALREENVKHFDMGNGVFQAVSYGHPVHELDENGQWQDIDFSLSLSQTRGVSTYSNKAAGVAFPSTYTLNQPLMILSGEGNSISMSLVTNASSGEMDTRSAATAVAAEVMNPRNSFDTVEDAAKATFSSTILYEDVLFGVDL